MECDINESENESQESTDASMSSVKKKLKFTSRMMMIIYECARIILLK